MMRRNHSTAHRSAPNPLVVLISAGLILALVGLLVWPRQPSKKQHTMSKPTLQRATVQSPSHRAEQPTQKLPQKSAVKGELKAFRAVISGPLSKSMQGALGKEKATFLAALTARLLIWRLDLRRDLRRGDKISVLYQPVDEQSQFQIMAMKYTSTRHNKTYHFYRYQQQGSRFAAYYDEQGQNIEQKLKHSPLREYDQVTSILKMRPKHKGVDFKTPVGTKVYLPWRARIVRTNWNFRYNGNCVEVEFLHGQQLRGLFLHLEKIKPEVRAGRVLPAGTVIATSGNTGRSTAPHLHYQLQTANGRIIDPYRFHPTYQASLPAEESDAFQSKRRQFDQHLASLLQ